MNFRVIKLCTVVFVALALIHCGSDDESSSVDCTGSTPSFSTDVRPLFISSGCTASGCHSGASPRGGMNLASGDVYSAVLARVNTSNPGGSEILEKPTGDDGHQAIWTTASTQYQTTYCWIENGASNN